MEIYLGMITAWGGDFEPRGWLFCDGREIPIAENDALFMLIGNKYGGDGNDTFALPKMDGPVQGMRALISMYGIFSQKEPQPQAPDIIGMATKYKHPYIEPQGTMTAEGQILQIATYSALHAIIGNKFGGDGSKGTFALPKIGSDWRIAVTGILVGPG